MLASFASELAGSISQDHCSPGRWLRLWAFVILRGATPLLALSIDVEAQNLGVPMTVELLRPAGDH